MTVRIDAALTQQEISLLFSLFDQPSLRRPTQYLQQLLSLDATASNTPRSVTTNAQPATQLAGVIVEPEPVGRCASMIFLRERNFKDKTELMCDTNARRDQTGPCV